MRQDSLGDNRKASVAEDRSVARLVPEASAEWVLISVQWEVLGEALGVHVEVEGLVQRVRTTAEI